MDPAESALQQIEPEMKGGLRGDQPYLQAGVSGVEPFRAPGAFRLEVQHLREPFRRGLGLIMIQPSICAIHAPEPQLAQPHPHLESFPVRQRFIKQTGPEEMLAANGSVARVKEGRIQVQETPTRNEGMVQRIDADNGPTADDVPAALAVGCQMTREE